MVCLFSLAHPGATHQGLTGLTSRGNPRLSAPPGPARREDEGSCGKGDCQGDQSCLAVYCLTAPGQAVADQLLPALELDELRTHSVLRPARRNRAGHRRDEWEQPAKADARPCPELRTAGQREQAER